MQSRCKCCDSAKELAVIMAGIAKRTHTIEDLKNAMRKSSNPNKHKVDENATSKIP
jgi:hypothetical protein